MDRDEMQKLEQDPELMSRAMPKIVLAAQTGTDFHDRIGAMLILLKNQDLIDTELLIPLLLAGRESCSSESDVVRRLALIEYGPLESELERLMDEMCAWDNGTKKPEESLTTQ